MNDWKCAVCYEPSKQVYLTNKGRNVCAACSVDWHIDGNVLVEPKTASVDWSENTVLLQPLARKLVEHLNRREYKDAELVADELSELMFDLKRLCIREQVLSGQGWK
jgi:hypothetical protein